MKRSVPFLLLAAFLLAACASQPVVTAFDPPGFVSGIWHGIIGPLALVAGIFSDVRIYAFPNSGWFYDLGFGLGIAANVAFWLFMMIALSDA
jgi:hypothetical protein